MASKTASGISEKQFQAQVLQLARLTGWLCYHTHDSRRSAPGFPDLVLIRPPAIIFAELKSAAGKLRPEQKVWLEILQRCPGVKVFVWRPSSWKEIQETLCRLDPGARYEETREIGEDYE